MKLSAFEVTLTAGKYAEIIKETNEILVPIIASRYEPSLICLYIRLLTSSEPLPLSFGLSQMCLRNWW